MLNKFYQFMFFTIAYVQQDVNHRLGHRKENYGEPKLVKI